MSAATIVEIRKVKGDLQQAHGHALSRDEAEKFLDLVEFINVEIDSYHPEVGRELMHYFAKVVAYCSDASVALEVIRRLKMVADTFHGTWSKEEVELISDTAHSLVGKFTKNARIRKSTVSQSAIALLKDLSTYKDLRTKKLNSHPRQLLASLKGQDEPDMGPPKKLRLDNPGEKAEEEEDEKYVEMMDQLVGAEDTDSALELEAQLEEMGYEPNVL